MGLFGKKNSSIPKFDARISEPVLRCSICTGEQVFCIINRDSGEMHELSLITSPSQLEQICRANGIDPASLRRIY